MQIVLLTEIFDCGGIDTFIINLITNWPNKNDKFILVANKDYPGLEIIQNQLGDKIEIRKYELTSYIRPFEEVTIIKKIAYPILKYYKLFYNIFAIKKILDNPNFDFLMVINGGYPGGDICRSAAISWAIFRKDKQKSVHNFHNLVTAPPFYLFFQELIVDKFISFSTSNFVTVSQSSKISMKNRPYLNNREIKYIYNGIKNFTNSSQDINFIKNELGLNKNIQICLMLATYEERKGHLFLLKAFNLVYQNNQNARLIICGFGSENEINKVKKYISDLNLDNCVYIFNFRIDKENLLRSSDILLISSQEFESFGLTAIEAMSFKKPIVSTDVGGLPEVIGEGYGGFCIPKDDYYQFSKKITLLLNDKNLYDKMSLRGYNRYLEFFTPDKMSNSYYKLINQINTEFQTKLNLIKQK
jgi:glycosyltransferase involved in cell wall biosynthesis